MIASWRSVHHDCLLAGSVGFVTRFFFMVELTDSLLNSLVRFIPCYFLFLFFAEESGV